MIGKNSFFTLLFALCAYVSHAQLDDLHYIPPMHSFNTAIDIGDHVLYISTPEVNPVNYSIEDGAGNVLQAGTVSNALPVTYSLTGTNTDFDVLEADLNTVLPDRGLIVSASDSVYANIRMRGGTAQAASITAKGRVAAGNDFRIFTAPLQAANSYRNHVVGVMATQNGTVVNIDLTGTGVTLHGVGAPATTNVISINMNAGDSYVFGASSATDPDNLVGMIGSRITSNNPIVVNSGSWTGSSVGAGGQDIIIDQMAPSAALGQEFVTVKGLGTNDQEGTMVIADINNTDIFINGSATPIATINAGDYFLIDGTNYINGALFIETSSPAYVWQVILGSNSTATQGGIFVPSLSCYSPTGVDLIPDIEMIGATVFSGGINVVTLAGATVTVNGAPIGVAPTAVTGSIYEYYQVLGLTGDVSVQSTESCAVAFFGASGAIGYGGYFSGFSDVVLNLGTDGLLNPNGSSYCLDSTALIDVNSDYAIQWLLNDIAIPGATSDTLIPTVGGYYSVEISSPGGLCTDTTNQVFVIDDLAPTASNPLPVNVQCIGDVPLPDINVVTDEADFCTTYPTVAFVSDVSDGLSCPETITRTYSVTDNSGNSINVTQTITVNDDVLPTASNPVPVNVQCIADVPVPDVTVVTDEADNCTLNPLVAFVSDVSDGLSCPETITRTYSVTDDCGNSINVMQTIVVNDDVLPTASNPTPVVVQCIADVPVPDITVVTDEADNCTVNPTVAFVSDVSDGLTCPETITRTYSVTDACGNSINVTQTITVNDTTNPTASNPLTVNVQCIGDVPVPDNTVVTDEADNCTVNPVVAFVSDISDGLSCPETITRTYSVTDDCGNSINVTQLIIVNDNIHPTASNPFPVNVECIGDVPAPDITVVTDETDNCTVNPVVAFVSDVSDGQSCPETITRTYSVTDDCGNSINVTQSIIVNDVTNPTASNPIAINVECMGDVPVPDITVVTDEADNCTVNPVVAFVSDVSDGLSCPETITRTYSVTDDCGNSINVTQSIIVNDVTNPTASNPLAVNVQCIGDVPVPDVAVVTDEADNCTVNPVVVFVSDVSDGLSCPETITRTYSVTDDCGNSINVEQTITVNDDVNPTASDPADVYVGCLSDVPPVDVAVVIDEADNCTAVPTVTYLNEQITGQVCDNQLITRFYSVTDDCGNSITVEHDIYVAASYAAIDAGSDLEVCEGTVVTLMANNPSAANISWTAPVQDNVAFVPPVGTNTYTVTADVCQGQCVSTDDVEVLVHPNPDVAFSVDDPLGCIDHAVTFTNSSTEATGGISYWTVGDGSEFQTDGNTSLWYTYTTPGLYDVTLEVVSSFGCSSILTYTDYIDVTPLPIAHFTFSPDNMSIEDNEISFLNQSLNAHSYQWYFDPLGSQSSEVDPLIHFPYEPNQSQEVTLYAISYGGCQDTITKTILTIDDPLFFIPNTFTPDGDEYNNTFKPVIAAGIDLTDYHLTIFNRWGEVIFESYDYEIGWDGVYDNVMVEDATYLWRLEFGTSRNDTRVIEVGHVNMIR